MLFTEGQKRKHYYSSLKYTTLVAENKTISLYYQGKYVILNLTPSFHPRTFQSLIEFSFANQGYKAFVPSFKTIALKATEQALSYLKSMLCQPYLLTRLHMNFQGVSCDKAL